MVLIYLWMEAKPLVYNEVLTMTDSFIFLTLTLLLILPGLVILIIRRDLWEEIRICMVLAIPFAFTEFMFVPEYWHPPFLFDLQQVLGFGIEDLLFVVSLSITAACSASFITRARLADYEMSPSIWIRIGIIPLVTGLIILSGFLRMNMLYCAFGIMLIAGTYMLIFRRDLIPFALLGGGSTAIIYFIVLLIFNSIFPGVFVTYWSMDNITGWMLLHVPIEELMYGFAAGFMGTCIYKFLFNKKLIIRVRKNNPTE